MEDAEQPRFLVRFWGVRGSYPTPGPHTLRHGGNTACVEVQAGMQTLIFDAGTGIIRLSDDLMKRSQGKDKLNLALFITHGHGDHLVGFPFFSPLFDPRANIHLFGPQLAGKDIEELVTPFISPPYFPVDMRQLPSRRTFHTIVDEQYIVWYRGEPNIYKDSAKWRAKSRDGEVSVSTQFTHSHPLDGAVIYRVEYAGRSVVYATDVEWQYGCEPAFLDFIEGADVLIHDAQYTNEDYRRVKQGYGHSTVEMATNVANAAHVGELILFHHEPTYDDDQLDTMEASARTHFERTRSACEGMQIDLLA